MKENSVRRIGFRLITLLVLLAGLAFFAADRPEYIANANNCAACDSAFPTCNNSCTSPVPCYGDCQYTYATCLWNCGDAYSRTPMFNYSQTCWENAESVFNHCLVGQMPGSNQYSPDYDDVYATCMANNDDNVYACCDEVRYAWWGFNGPNCY